VPSTDAVQVRHDPLRHGGMTRADNPVNLAAAPADADIERGLERRRDAAQRVERESSKVTALDPRDARLRDAGRTRDVDLVSAPMESSRPQRPARPLVVLPTRVVDGRAADRRLSGE
jgi:hypothetical protein